MGSQRAGHDWSTFTFTVPFQTQEILPSLTPLNNILQTAISSKTHLQTTSKWNLFHFCGTSNMVTCCKVGNFPSLLLDSLALLVVQLVKNLLAMWDTWVRSLGWEGSLQKGYADHSSILAWRMPWTVQSMGSQRVGYDWVTFTSLCKIDSQCEFVVWHRAPKAGALWHPGRMGWGGRWDQGSGWSRYMYTYGRFILMYVKTHHNIVK